MVTHIIKQPHAGLIVNKNLVFNTVDCWQGIHLASLTSRNEDTYNLYADYTVSFYLDFYLIQSHFL